MPPTALPTRPFVLVPSSAGLLGLERQPTLHNTFGRNFRSFIAAVDLQFDVCVIDTNPNPDIRVIAAQAGQHLQPGGWLLLEHGWDQADAVAQLLGEQGYVEVQHRTDLAGHLRCTGGRRAAN